MDYLSAKKNLIEIQNDAKSHPIRTAIILINYIISAY